MSEENTNQPQPQQKQLNLDDIDVSSQDIALNLMAQFLELGQKRGAYTFQEASKIYDCLKFFKPKNSELENNKTEK
jgi:hypothetical protein